MIRSCALAICFAPLVASSADGAQVEHALPRGSTLRTNEVDQVVTDRETLNQISVESKGSVDLSLEAYWSSDEFELYFSYDPVGYVRMDDWQELDVDELCTKFVH
jgi:hypothetical protein